MIIPSGTSRDVKEVVPELEQPGFEVYFLQQQSWWGPPNPLLEPKYTQEFVHGTLWI